jgi:hypothetical protein
LLQAAYEVVELGLVGGGVAVQEEGQERRRGLGAGCAGVAHAGGGLVADAEHACGTERLQPLVIAERAAPAVDDLAERTVGGPQQDHGRVDVPGLGDERLDQVRGHGLHLDDVAQKEARHVEVVDRHVPEQAA